METPFIEGLELSRLLYEESVAPLLAEHFSALPHSAGLLFHGSEVLGFDTPQSRDHDWGPRLQLFLADSAIEPLGSEIDMLLRRRLPSNIHGYPINMACGEEARVTMGQEAGHAVMITTVRRFAQHVLVWDCANPPDAVDWVTFPQQHLRSIRSGALFHDGLGTLTPLRKTLSTYPHDVWLYLMAAQWQRISEEEHFMGRCGQVGDDLGSRLIATRLARDIMGLCFFIERRYAPYIKWFGSAFAELTCAGPLQPILTEVLRAETWQERERHLSAAYEQLATLHNALSITPPLPTEVTPFHDRPFQVIQAGRFVDALRDEITDPDVLALPPQLGGLDQWTDSTEVYNSLRRLNRFTFAYR
jgi:hypothetical protein